MPNITLEQYQIEVAEDLKSCLEDMSCQPVLFVGSGFSKRYFGAPNWDELLTKVLELCPDIDKPFAYYKQKDGENTKIATTLSSHFLDWAWKKNEEANFPADLFLSEEPRSGFLKYKVTEIIKSLPMFEQEEYLKKELDAFKAIQPHAIITTNFDLFLESLCPDYEVIIGQKVLQNRGDSIGEIFKIHGCATQRNSLILTEEDYAEFRTKRKYLSAKLLTYFIEHPLVFIGYSVQDSNIRALLSDIDEILGENGDLISNIYFIQWENIINSNSLKKEELIPVEDNKQVRVKTIIADRFEWIFNALKPSVTANRVSIKTLRALSAKSYKFFRCDLAKNILEVDYTILERAASGESEFAKILGITNLEESHSLTNVYPFTLTGVAHKLGLKNWNAADKLIQKISVEKNVNIKSSDNRYHQTIRTGTSPNSQCKKYSDSCIALLEKVMKNESYSVEL